MNTIPFSELTTLFLDVGNTLISIDFAWVCRELAERGIPCEPEALRRAEAAGRPNVSELVDRLKRTEGRTIAGMYLENMVRWLETDSLNDDQLIADLVEELVPVLWRPGESDRLWTYVLPGAAEALDGLRGLGLQLVAVSNSDGTVERLLAAKGLRHHFDAVLDSHILGYEKPDPRIFEHALALAGSEPERTLHVGDMYAADVVGARAAGLHALLLDPFDDWTDVDCPLLPDVMALFEAMKVARES